MVPTVESRSIESMKLKRNRTIQSIGSHNYGRWMLPDGGMVFTNYFQSAVRVFSNKGVIDFKMKITCSAYDIVYNSEDNTLAVTSGDSVKHCIIIIDLDRKQIKKTISLDSEIYGIALKDNRLIYSGYDKGIRMINICDEFISDIVRDKMPRECYIATVGNQIYYTNCLKNTVTCYELQGKLQWTFCKESILKDPRGIDVDNYGYVYVMGVKSYNVVVISPDGQQHREMLAKSDGISQPLSLCFSN
ncbi:unnamed protein product [Mytilus coruscus]|uniref:Uncharacterized protein n=1 Tax=Mytilus coruscus TaxID=42192 RepID=A0A6J8BQ78_MYTCO|nr:unnamed protein product [Mytilus coruscus]